jgi:hypothetical protein
MVIAGEEWEDCEYEAWEALVNNGMVVKLADDKYRITTFGIVQMQKDTIPRIRAKVDA